MSLKLPIGKSDFKSIIKEGDYFVDKSLFIQSVLEDSAKVLLFTRPRRFGKTLNLSMLYYFLEGFIEEREGDLFDGLGVKKNQGLCERYQNRYPVILISFKDIKKKSFAEVYEAIAMLMSDLYEKFSTFLMEGLSKRNSKYYEQILNCEGSKELVEKALYYLCQWLHEKTGEKVVILIDEYDTPMSESYINGYYDVMTDIMRSIMSWALKDNVSLEKGVVTGITRITKESIFSDLNHLEIYSVMDPSFPQYFGFSEEEVEQLLKDDGHPEQQGKIKAWYNGYQFGGETLYNPWSILKCVKRGYLFEPYWINTSSNMLIKNLLGEAKGSVKAALEKLLQGKVISQPVDEHIIFLKLKVSEEALWGLLVAAGYLKVVERPKENSKICQLAIPNKEILFVFREMVYYWFNEAFSEEGYQQFIRSLVEGDIETFSYLLNRYLQESGSYFDFNRHSEEKVFHTFVLGLVVGLQDRYVIQSNRESGLGRFDVMMQPRDRVDRGIILEFKTTEKAMEMEGTSEKALAQIKGKGYLASLKQQGCASALLLGVAFCGQQAVIQSETVSL